MGERLAIAGMNVVYGDDTYPTNGPFMSTVSTNDLGDGTMSVTIEFDQAFTYDTSETNGFYACCGVDFTTCDTQNGLWQLVIPQKYFYARHMS